MHILKKSLAQHTSFRCGGDAVNVVAAESIEELAFLKKCYPNAYILGRGSNTLAADRGFDGTVIKTTALRRCERSGVVVRAEAGLNMPTFVRDCAKMGLGGCEYLVSVPGTIGGGVVMNAGRGKAWMKSIADHVLKVEMFDGQRIVEICASELKLDYRFSRFQEEDSWVVLAVHLKLHKMSCEIINRRIRERIEYVRHHQDLQYPNAGTIYSQGFQAKIASPGHRIGHAEWSQKIPNWINNLGGATSGDVFKLITEYNRTHLEFHSVPPKLELKLLGNFGSLI